MDLDLNLNLNLNLKFHENLLDRRHTLTWLRHCKLPPPWFCALLSLFPTVSALPVSQSPISISSLPTGQKSCRYQKRCHQLAAQFPHPFLSTAPLYTVLIFLPFRSASPAEWGACAVAPVTNTRTHEANFLITVGDLLKKRQSSEHQ